MSYPTADLCDANTDAVTVADPIFKDYGKRLMFHGQITTLKVHEDNSLVREAVGQPGAGKVLVVDGGGSMRCALLGDNLAEMAYQNGWAGIVIYGCIRDSAVIGEIELGVKAMNTHPLKSVKKGRGDIDLPVTFAGITFFPGHYLYADVDGVIVSETELASPAA